jgi:hypothetical protein
VNQSVLSAFTIENKDSVVQTSVPVFKTIVETSSLDISQEIVVAETKNKGKMMTDEDNEVIRVGFQSYKRYFMNYYGGWKFIIAS